MSFRLLRVLIAVCMAIPAVAQTQPAAPASQQQAVDPLKRPIDKKTQKQQSKRLMSETYGRWPDSDAVRWIITDEEREAFLELSNDDEREQFIEAFWGRRDPTPDTIENEYKEEHYRRVAYANEHFSAGKPGWLTDRGHIYIAWGPPDQIDSHPSGGYVPDGPQQTGGVAVPFEVWRYRHLEGRDLGQEIEIEFVDTCMCGDYHMTIDPTEKSALKNTPGHQKDFGPQFGMNQSSKQFDDLARQAALFRAPELKFRDLVPHVGTTVRFNVLPFDVRADFVRLTPDIVLVPVTVQLKNKELVWTGKDGVQRMTVNILGRVTGITGRVAQTFEDTVTDMVADDLLPKIAENSHVYWKALPLPPGNYRLDLVLKDVNSDRLGTWSKRLSVPRYDDEHLATSTLILADVMERVPKTSLSTGNFVIGDTKVRPRLDSSDGKPASFKRSQPLNLWMQVYNLRADEKTHKPDATLQYEIVNSVTKKSAWKLSETTGQLANPGEQITLQKTLPLASFEPGTYELSIKVEDKVSAQTTTSSAKFTVQ